MGRRKGSLGLGGGIGGLVDWWIGGLVDWWMRDGVSPLPKIPILPFFVYSVFSVV